MTTENKDTLKGPALLVIDDVPTFPYTGPKPFNKKEVEKETEERNRAIQYFYGDFVFTYGIFGMVIPKFLRFQFSRLFVPI